MSKFYRTNQLIDVATAFRNNPDVHHKLIRLKVYSSNVESQYLNVSPEELAEIIAIIRKRDNAEVVD